MMGWGFRELGQLIRGARENPLVSRFRPNRLSLNALPFWMTVALSLLLPLAAASLSEPENLLVLSFLNWPLVAAIHFLLLAPTPMDRAVHTELLLTAQKPREVLFGYLFWPAIATLLLGAFGFLAILVMYLRGLFGDVARGIIWTAGDVESLLIIGAMLALLPPVGASLCLEFWATRRGWRWFAILLAPPRIFAWGIFMTSVILIGAEALRGHSWTGGSIMSVVFPTPLLCIWAWHFLQSRLYRLESLLLADLDEGIAPPPSPLQEAWRVYRSSLSKIRLVKLKRLINPSSLLGCGLLFSVIFAKAIVLLQLHSKTLQDPNHTPEMATFLILACMSAAAIWASIFAFRLMRNPDSCSPVRGFLFLQPMTSALLPAISLAVAVELAIFPTWYPYHPMEGAARFILLWGVLWLAGMAACALRPRTVLVGGLALLLFAPLLTMSDWIVSRTDVDRVAAIGFLLLLVAIAYTPMLFMWTHQRWFGDSEARKPSP